MKYDRLQVEFLLDNMSLSKRLITGKSSKHLVVFKLIWPRPTIKSRDFLQLVEVDESGKISDKLTWDQQIICKETIQGPFALKIGIYKNMSSKKITEFANSMLSETTERVGEYLEDIIDIPLLSDLVELPFDYISDKISDSSEESGIIGSTCINMEIYPEQASIQATADLTTPKDFYTTKRHKIGGKRTSVRTKVLTKGEIIGKIGITFKVYE